LASFVSSFAGVEPAREMMMPNTAGTRENFIVNLETGPFSDCDCKLAHQQSYSGGLPCSDKLQT